MNYVIYYRKQFLAADFNFHKKVL